MVQDHEGRTSVLYIPLSGWIVSNVVNQLGYLLYL